MRHPAQHDQARREDMDSNLEDHTADEWRYACMSQPWVKTEKEKRPEWVKGRLRESRAGERWLQDDMSL
jgi:hypothetical protein